MPSLTETIDATILAAAAEGISSYTVDSETVVSIDPLKLLALRNAAAELATPRRSGWGRVFMARAVPPSAGPQ